MSAVLKKPLKPKACVSCRGFFVPFQSMQRACGPKCAEAWAKLKAAKRAERKAREEKRERKAKLQELKPLSYFVGITQAAFNGYCRERDRYQPCISCGTYEVTFESGGGWDAGHYRTVGACPELRFCELNVHKQCKSCNSGLRRNGKRVKAVLDPERALSIRAAYRTNLIERIGLEKVEWLEGPHPPAKWTREELQQLAADYRAKTRELQKSRPGAFARLSAGAFA